MSESTDELSNAEEAENEVQEPGVSEENSATGIDPVSYTHLTLPTTPYV